MLCGEGGDYSAPKATFSLEIESAVQQFISNASFAERLTAFQSELPGSCFIATRAIEPFRFANAPYAPLPGTSSACFAL